MEGEDSELTEQDRRTLKTLARTIQESEVDRRDLLKMGLGGAIGVGASQLVTGGAMADASTSDSDGDVGEPGNRIDVFADGVDANSVNTDASSVTNLSAVTYPSSNQSVASATNTKIQFDAVEVEDSAVLDVDLTNHVVNVQTDGDYFVSLTLNWDGDSGWSTGDFATPNINVNGSLVGNYSVLKIGIGDEGKFALYQSEFQAGDTIRIDAYQNSGASKTINGGQALTRLQVARLG